MLLYDGVIAVKCPEYQALKAVPETYIGQKIKCKKYGNMMEVIPLRNLQTALSVFQRRVA